MYHQYQFEQNIIPRVPLPIDRGDTPSTALATDRFEHSNTNNMRSCCFGTPSMSMENNAPSAASSPVHWSGGGNLHNAKAFALARRVSLTDSSFSSVTLPSMCVRDAPDANVDNARALGSTSPTNGPNAMTPTSDAGNDREALSSMETTTTTTMERRRSSSSRRTSSGSSSGTSSKTTPRRHSTGTVGSEAEETDELEDQLGRFVPMQAARAHWMQLHKQHMQTLDDQSPLIDDCQVPVLQRMFLRLLQRHAPLRALWPFGRCFGATPGKQKMMDHQQLLTSAAFQHFCATYQASLTTVMDTLDDEPSLCRMLQGLGANHFFYDANETHFKMMREEFLMALDECLVGTSEELNDELEQDWDQLWAKMESNLAFGLAVQRHNFLAHCVTGKEMDIVRSQWHTLLEAKCPMDALGAAIRGHGIQTFSDVHNCIVGQEILPREKHRQQFTVAVNDLLWAMAQAISLWEPGTGFLRLCAEIDARCGGAFDAIRTVSSALLRKAFLEGLFAELAALLGENEATATAMHSWTKVYRVAEQAIIADGMDKERTEREARRKSEIQSFHE